MRQYLDVVRHVLEHGTRKPNRTGVDTLSVFNVNYQMDLREGFPLLTTKEICWKNIVIENLWFLSGRRDLSLLHMHGCRFWDPWVDSDGEVPSAYGNLWRHFPVGEGGGSGSGDGVAGAGSGGGDGTHGNDQLAWVLAELKRNPLSRRLVVSAWAPGNAQHSALPPCHAFWVLNVQHDEDGEPILCLHLTQRSCDVALGLPYNIAGYALLLELFAQFSGMRAGLVAHSLVDAHVYIGDGDDNSDGHSDGDDGANVYNHVPNLKEQLTRTPQPLPQLVLDSNLRSMDDVLTLLGEDTQNILSHFQIKNYHPAPTIAFKVAV